MAGGSALALTLLVGACPEPTVKPQPLDPPAQPLSVLELCTVYVAQDYYTNFLGAASSCVQNHLLTGKSYTEAELARACRPGSAGRQWAEDLLGSVAAGRVAIDWKLAHACLDGTRGWRETHGGYERAQDKAWASLRDGPCTAFVQGVTPDGQVCVHDWDCSEGSSCASDRPFAEDGLVCLKPGALNQACGDYHACEATAYCSGGRCMAKRQDGGRCDPDLYGDDCLSGSCSDSGTCDPTPPDLKEYGDACSDDEECGGLCAKCRPTAAGGALSCQVLGKAGDYCRDWLDCLDDLGCTSHACGTVAAGERCGGTVQAVCAPELYCIPTANCGSYTTQATCQAQAPTCAWDADYAECAAVEGVCTVETDLPTQGPCLHGYVCGVGAYCAGALCARLAAEGEACSADGTGAPYCNSGLSCVSGRCKLLCDYDQDCGPGLRCGDDGACVAREPFVCADSSECPASTYCRIPEDPCAGQSAVLCNKIQGCEVVDQGSCSFVSDCATFNGNGAGCGQAQGCRYDPPSKSCAPVCYFYDNDQSGCEAADCAYDALFGYCDPVCGQYNDAPTTCAAQATCTFAMVQVCELTQSLTGQCTPLLDTGAACDDAEQCQSGDCAYDEDSSAYRCAVALPGCYRDIGFVREAFLFGVVFVLGRNLRRRRA